jgi:hypothetical protein
VNIKTFTLLLSIRQQVRRAACAVSGPSVGGCRVNIFGCVTIWLGFPVIAGKVFGGYRWPSRFGT